MAALIYVRCRTAVLLMRSRVKETHDWDWGFGLVRLEWYWHRLQIGASIKPAEVSSFDTWCTFQAQVAITSITPSYTPLSLRLLGVIHKFSSGERNKKSCCSSRISSRCRRAILLMRRRVKETHDWDGGFGLVRLEWYWHRLQIGAKNRWVESSIEETWRETSAWAMWFLSGREFVNNRGWMEQ